MFQLYCVTIIVICLQFTVGGVMKAEDLPIKYPGPAKGVSDVPPECKDQNFCTIKPADYPQEQFDKMFHGSTLGKLPNLVIKSEMEFPNRQGGPGEEDDCRTTVTYEPLYKVRSKRGDWRLVINSEEQNYVQKVRLETCVKPESKCFTRFSEIPGIETFCRQNYNDWEIVVSDGKGGTETVTTSLPVCCSCHYRSVDINSRFGGTKNVRN